VRISESSIKCVPNSKKLVAEGHIVDSIKNVSKSRNIEQQWTRHFKEVDTMIGDLDSNLSGEPRKDLKWKAPIAGALYSKEVPLGNIELQASYKALRKVINKAKYKSGQYQTDTITITKEAKTMNESGQQSSLCSKCLNCKSILEGTLHEWRFFTTQRGYVGIGPKATEIGDIVIIISGGRLPFLLRKSEMLLDSHRLVGEYYVHGIMDGEGLHLKDVVKKDIILH
jgi:hypothetical protein